MVRIHRTDFLFVFWRKKEEAKTRWKTRASKDLIEKIYWAWHHALTEVHRWFISHPYRPVWRGDVQCNDSLLGCVRSDLERESLASKAGKCLVRSSPVMAHANPSCSASLHPHAGNVTTSSYIRHIHQQPVPIPLESESKPANSYTRYSARYAG